MEKSCAGQEGHPASRVNFIERLYERNVDSSARGKSWLCIDNSARACSDRLSLTELTRLGEPVSIWRKVGPASRATLPSQKGDPARRVTLLAEPTFCFSCKRLAKGVSRKLRPQTLKTQTFWMSRKLRPSGFLENSDPKNSDPLSVSKTQTLRKLVNFERFLKP